MQVLKIFISQSFRAYISRTNESCECMHDATRSNVGNYSR